MRACDMKRLGPLFVLVLFILSAPAWAAGITVRVPETDIVGELKVDRCEIFRLDDYHLRGCHIEVSFLRTSGSDSIEEKSLRWLQLVSTNHPSLTNDATQLVHFIDTYDYPTSFHVSEEPFYISGVDLYWQRSDSELFFVDTPHTNSWYYGRDFEWYDGWTIKNQFELYLVRQLDKAIQILAKITWGYRVDTRGVVVLYHPRLQNQNMPSQILEQTLAEEFPDWNFTEAAGGDGNVEPSGIGDGGGGGCFIGTVGSSLLL